MADVAPPAESKTKPAECGKEKGEPKKDDHTSKLQADSKPESKSCSTKSESEKKEPDKKEPGKTEPDKTSGQGESGKTEPSQGDGEKKTERGKTEPDKGGETEKTEKDAEHKDGEGEESPFLRWLHDQRESAINLAHEIQRAACEVAPGILPSCEVPQDPAAAKAKLELAQAEAAKKEAEKQEPPKPDTPPPTTDASIWGNPRDWLSQGWQFVEQSSLGQAVIQPIEHGAYELSHIAYDFVHDDLGFIFDYGEAKAESLYNSVMHDNGASAWTDTPQIANGQSITKVEVPKDAKEAGKENFAGQNVTKLTSERTGETFLRNEKGEIIAKRDKGQHEFTRIESEGALRSEFKGGAKIDAPKDLEEQGKQTVAGNEVTILKSKSTNETFLRNDKTGEIFVKAKGNNEFEIKLANGNKADVKLSGDKQHGFKQEKYEERDSQNRVVRKYKDGITYEIHYTGEHGRPLKHPQVSAAGEVHLDHTVTKEEMQKKLQEIAKEMGADPGEAVVKFHNDKTNKVTLTDLHKMPDGNQMHLDFTNKEMRMLVNGKTYVVSKNDKDVDIIGDDGKQRELAEQEKKELGPLLEWMHKHLEEGKKICEGKRHGFSDDDEVEYHLGPSPEDLDKKVLKVVQKDHGEPIQTITASEDPKTGVESKNEVTGETSIVYDHNYNIVDPQGKSIYSFDPKTGATTDRFTLDDRGLTDNQTGTRMDANGDVYDRYGNRICSGHGSDSGSFAAQQRAAVAQAIFAANTASDLASRAISLCFTPGNLSTCEGLCWEAYGVANKIDVSFDFNRVLKASALGNVFDGLDAVHAGGDAFYQLQALNVPTDSFDTARFMTAATGSVSGAAVIDFRRYKELRDAEAGLTKQA